MRFLLIPLVVLALASCAADVPPGETPTAQSPTAEQPSQTPSETPGASESPTAAAATCESLLDPESLEKGEAEGGSVSTFTAEEAEEGGTLTKFIEYGGIACSFGADMADNPVLYAYGPITEDQADTEMAHLDKVGGESGTNENGGTYYGGADDTEIYVFSPAGYWAYQYNNGFGNVINPDSVSETIEEVVANAPAFY